MSDTTEVHERVTAALRATHRLLDDEGVWHCLAYGTLLGAVREGSTIEWDTDFDIFIRPTDVATVLSLRTPELAFETVAKPGSHLAMGAGQVAWFSPARLAAIFEGHKIGDVYFPTVFNDGALRIYDLEREVLWTPHSSFPHYFLQQCAGIEIDGVEMLAPTNAERFLEGVYGSNWRVPYRAAQHGGVRRPDATVHGDTYLPKLKDELAWCVDRGWDVSIYRDAPSWPRAVRGSGPVGPTDETALTSTALWWRDLDELITHF